MIIIIIRSEEEDGQRVLKKGGINTVTGRHIPITMRESHAPTQQREREKGGPFFIFLPDTFDMKKEREKTKTWMDIRCIDR